MQKPYFLRYRQIEMGRVTICLIRGRDINTVLDHCKGA